MEKSQCDSNPPKKMINSASKTTNLSLCFRCAVRSLKDFYLTNCSSFLMKIIIIQPVRLRPGDSCINQLLSMTHKIYQSFDNDLEVRGMFLDISKAFHKVWHEGLNVSLNGLSGNLLYLLKDFLKYQKQRVVLNGLNSSWKGITSGVPEGSILGPLLFLIYIKDLPDGLSLNWKLFAEDTSLFSVIHDNTISSSELNGNLAKISEWAFKWKISFNPGPYKPAQEVIFSR